VRQNVNAILLFAFLLSLPAPLAFADMAAIHENQLPQETTVLAALDDARQLEPYCHSWTMNWKFPVAKEDVAARLGKDLGFLTIALKSHPDNAELLLLTGLVARYAYNLDVPNSYDRAMSAFDQAQKLAPSDVRAPWFRSTLLCQTTSPKAGAEGFLSIEDSHAWDQLPAAFWHDYMECTELTNMPAHVLRAADHLDKLHAPDSKMRDSLTDIARKRFDPFDPKKSYDPKEVWRGTRTGEDVYLTGTSCGVRLSVHGDWAIGQLALGNGVCMAYFSTGPYKATTRDLQPGVMLLVRQPKENETLQDFLRLFTKGGTFDPFTVAHCPAASCIAMRGVQPGMYDKDGDGHGRVVVFERDQPEFPGLIFEAPLEIPKSEGGEGPKFYRPNQMQQRMPGKLYYLVLLDTAVSIEEPAMKDFDFFLQNLVVE
jgi:hypothetical protein